MIKENCVTKEEEVKKLILVGNGCDLAMGLPTSYSDFMLWFTRKYLLKALEKEPLPKNSPFKNGIIKYETSKMQGRAFVLDNVLGIFIPYSIDQGEDSIEIIKRVKECHSFKDLKTVINEFNIYISHTNISNKYRSLIQSVIVRGLNGWVDIEELFYTRLKEIIKSGERTVKYVKSLNQEMERLTLELNEYLLSQVEPHIFKIPNRTKAKIAKQFREPIPPEPGNSCCSSEIAKDKNIFLINFNYTDSLLGDPFHDFKHIHIHGHSIDDSSEIVFGYGDEMDDSYKMIENLNKNEYLRKFKSFGYFQYSQYRQLLSIVNSGSFDVVIYGHSCGLSDRVLLNEIFEHKNCRYIRVYYYRDKNDYIDKTMNISRHFNSNQLMRQRVINFQEGDVIPQVND